MSINDMLKCNEIKNTSMSFLPTFYEHVFVSFNECTHSTAQFDNMLFFQQPLWNNRYF